MDETLKNLAIVAALVWPTTEMIGRAATAMGDRMKWLHNKDLVALILGPVMGIVVHGGALSAMPGAWGWANSIMLGLFATAGAAGSHKVVKAGIARVKNGSA